MLNLKKGGSVSLDLTKRSGRKLAFIGLGWDSPADLDASLIMLNASGMPRTEKDLYYYNNLFNGHIPDQNDNDDSLRRQSPIVHMGDARESADDDNGDEEVILIDFDKIPSDVAKLAVVVSIYNDEDADKVVFGQVTNAYVRLCSCTNESSWLQGEGGTEEIHFDLEEDASTSNAMLFCEIIRNGTDWDFIAMEEPIGNGEDSNGLSAIVRKYGLA